MNYLNPPQTNSNNATDSSTEMTEEKIKPTENITSNSSPLPKLQTITNSDSLISNARKKQIFLLPQSFYSKQMQKILIKKRPHSQNLAHRLILKDSNVSIPPAYADKKYLFSRSAKTHQRV